MNNILLVFLNELELEDELNKIIDRFNDNNYKIFILDNIKEDEYFSFDSLPVLVESYKEEYKNLNKVVVLSNSRDLLFSWYRCYNSVVDDFIYFIDEDENNYFVSSDDLFCFFSNLHNFNGIDDETVQGKIYVNINFNNYHKIISFLLQEGNYRYFDSLNKFYSNDEIIQKELLSKKYKFKGTEYYFEINNLFKEQEISMSREVYNDINLNENFVKQVMNYNYLIPYITVLSFKSGTSQFSNFIVYLFKKLKEVDVNIQRKIFKELFYHISDSNINFKEKIYIASLLTMINNGYEKLTKLIMDTLLQDKEYMEYHFEVITNILFYESNENLKRHNEYYKNLRDEVGRLSEWVTNGASISRSIQHKDSKKIAIIVDQLLLIGHSPTKLALDYARNIRKYYPGYEVKIFVEDNLYCKNEIGMIPYLFTSAISSSLKNQHRQYLDDTTIDIIYADVNLSKKERTRRLIKELINYGMDLVLTDSDISISSRSLYGKFPVIYMSRGGDYFSNLADAYLCVSRDRVIEQNLNFKLFDEDKLFEIKTGLEFEKSKRVIQRSEYNIKENDFVMISVGNRLDSEIDQEFIDHILGFMESNDNVKWLIVGPKDIHYLPNKYGKLMTGRIINIKYEDDLSALYRICDVYINPRRKGGGISIAMAMNEGLPIVITKNSTDGVSYVGESNTTENSMDEYIGSLNQLYLDMDKRKEFSTKMRTRISQFSYEDSIKNIMNIIDF